VRLSILSPSYNYGRFLDDALRSVRAQGEVEHVVVDGGSTDETVDLLAAAPSNVVWRSEPDRGQSDALNKALALSSGDWIGWLNVDEFYLPGAFESLAEALARRPDADLVHGDAVFVDPDGRLRRLVGQHPPSRRVLRWNRCYISSCAAFIRRGALPPGGWDVGLRTVMDWDLYLRLERRGARFAYIPRPLAAFRVHPQQVTAAPLPWDSCERELLRQRYDLPNGLPGRLASRAGQLEHRALKLVTGTYLRELRVLALGRPDLRWFASAPARNSADRVAEAGSGRLR
jgi:glycosyltransferase involved in cell wall biosynthesis